MTNEDKRALAEGFWAVLATRDFEKLGVYFAADGLYEDVPTPDAGARGPAAIAARLRTGLGSIQGYEHDVHRIVVEGDTIVTEHTETWHFDDEHSVALPFVSIFEIDAEGKLTLWRDYWDMPTLLNAAPQWWLDDIMKKAEEIGLR